MDFLCKIGRRAIARKSYIVLIVCFGFIFGIIAHSFFNFKFDFFWIYNALLFVGILLLIFWREKKARLILIGAFFVIAGFARFDLGIEKNKILPQYWEEKVKIIGQVVSEPSNKINKQQLIIKPSEVAKKKFTGREKILITANLYPQYNYGDILEIDCKLAKPAKYDTFDYARYLSMQNIYGLCYWPKIEISAEAETSMMARLLKAKSFLISKLNQNLHEPFASFLSGLVIGARNAIPPELLDNFQRTGTTHIIAISGWNITFLGTIFMPILFYLGFSRKPAFYMMIGFIVLFVLLVGIQASVVRAAIMGILALYALAFSRYNHAGRAFLYSIMLMFLINSHIVYDVGFWLSSSATFGLIYFSPLVEKFLDIKNKLLRETLVPTISAVIFTLPISSFVFGHISLWSLPVNLLIVPFVAYAIIFSLPVLPFLSFIPQEAVQILLLPSVAVLNFIVKIINLFGNIPFGYLPIKINFLVMLLFYMGIIWFTFWRQKKLNDQI